MVKVIFTINPTYDMVVKALGFQTPSDFYLRDEGSPPNKKISNRPCARTTKKHRFLHRQGYNLLQPFYVIMVGVFNPVTNLSTQKK